MPKKTTQILGALIAGTLIGATLGILLAPNRGRVTRKIMLGKANDIALEQEEEEQDKMNVVRAKKRHIESLANDKIKMDKILNIIQQKVDTVNAL